LTRRSARRVARDPRVPRDAAGALDVARVPYREVVGRPLPDVAGHVVKPVAVRRERPDRRGAFVPVELQVLPGKLALPGVRHRLSAGEVLVAPTEDRTVQPAAGGVLPLCFGRQPFARPRRVGLGVLIGDLYDRVTVATVDRRAR